MNRIDCCFATLAANGRKGLIAYLTAGDPDLETTGMLVRELAGRGVSMVELGVPFSDPVADGPIIQAASLRALRQGITLADVLALAGRLRQELDIPLLIMTYYNPVFAYGIDDFVAAARKNGLDGIIVPDLPLEESEALSTALQQAGLHLICLLAPTSADERIAAAAERAGGFIYCVSVAGVTGARDAVPEAGSELLKRVRLYTSVPLALGFGISRPEQMAALGENGAAVIIGSALVRLVEEGGTPEEIAVRVGTFADQFLG